MTRPVSLLATSWLRAAALFVLFVTNCHASGAAQGLPPEGSVLTADARRTSAVVEQLAAAARPKIALRWLDTGITLVGKRHLSGGHFTPFGKPPLVTDYYASLFGVAKSGQIVVRMPERWNEWTGKDRRLTREEWEIEGEAMAERLYQVIQKRAAEGINEIEIRTVQVINPAGYLDPFQQAQIEEFARTFLVALYRVRERLETEGATVTATAACGSNGCYAASRAIPWLAQRGMNPIEAILMYDGRAFERDAARLIEALEQRVAIINTSGDVAGSARDFWLFVAATFGNHWLWIAADAFPRMIANFDCSRRLKAQYSGIRVFHAAHPDNFLGIGFWFTRHITMMQAGSVSLVKEWMGENRPPRRLGRLLGTDLAAEVLQPLDYGVRASAGGRIAGDRTLSLQRAERDEARRPERELADESDSRCGSEDHPCFASSHLAPFPQPCPPWSPWCWLPLGGGPPPCDPDEELCRDALADADLYPCDSDKAGCGNEAAEAGIGSAAGWSLFEQPGDPSDGRPGDVSVLVASFGGEGDWWLPAAPGLLPGTRVGRVFVLFESVRGNVPTEFGSGVPLWGPAYGERSYELFSTTGPGKRGGTEMGRNRNPARHPPPWQGPPGRQPKPGPRPGDQRFSIWSSSAAAAPASSAWPDFLRYGVLPIFEPFPDLENGRWTTIDILISR